MIALVPWKRFAWMSAPHAPFSHLLRSLPPVVRQLLILHVRHFHEDVHRIDKRPADAPAGSVTPCRRTFTVLDGVAVIAARTRVHRAYKHEFGGESNGALCPAYRHKLIFQRLAQHFQHRVSEFGKLIQEKDAVVAQADFPRPGPVSAPHQPRVGDGVVGRAKGTQPD